MWNKLLSDLSFLWSKLWSPLLAAGLVAGFTLLLKRRDENRGLRKNLSEKLYIPIREQLSDAQHPIRDYQRALSFNIEPWKKACASGAVKNVRPRVKNHIRKLYEETLPRYDNAWKELNDELGRLGREWDSRFADIKDYRSLGIRAAVQDHEYNTVTIDWWRFLNADGPQTPIDNLRDGDVLRMWDGFVTASRLQSLHQPAEQFLIKLWSEAALNPALRQYRACRQLALQEIPKAIAILSREILY
jgi:hypothetical protein